MRGKLKESNLFEKLKKIKIEQSRYLRLRDKNGFNMNFYGSFLILMKLSLLSFTNLDAQYIYIYIKEHIRYYEEQKLNESKEKRKLSFLFVKKKNIYNFFFI